MPSIALKEHASGSSWYPDTTGFLVGLTSYTTAPHDARATLKVNPGKECSTLAHFRSRDLEPAHIGKVSPSQHHCSSCRRPS